MTEHWLVENSAAQENTDASLTSTGSLALENRELVRIPALQKYDEFTWIALCDGTK